jgi:CheY-like chemotaxis protein
MPEMNGIELTEKIKKKYGWKIVVIMISASEWESIEEEAKKTGVDGFISKPLFPSVLTECINTQIGKLAAREGKSEPIKNMFAGKHILLAEDVEINREIVNSLLEDTGVTIDNAVNGLEAIQKFEAAPSHYDIIFMDIHMPELDGYEATKRIRSSKIPGADTIPIVAMTANVFKEDVERCLAAGMNDHLGKPVDFDELMKRLKKYLFR